MSQARPFSDGTIRVSYDDMFRLSEEIRRITRRLTERIDVITRAADMTTDWDTDSSDVVRGLAKSEFAEAEPLKRELISLYADLGAIISVYRTAENAVVEETRDLPSAIFQ